MLLACCEYILMFALQFFTINNLKGRLREFCFSKKAMGLYSKAPFVCLEEFLMAGLVGVGQRP